MNNNNEESEEKAGRPAAAPPKLQPKYSNSSLSRSTGQQSVWYGDLYRKDEEIDGSEKSMSLIHIHNSIVIGQFVAATAWLLPQYD